MSFLSKCKNVDIPIETNTESTDKANDGTDASLRTDVVTIQPKNKPPSKGSTMTIIESLMNSALNAEKVLHSFPNNRPSYANTLAEMEDLKAFGITPAADGQLIGGGSSSGVNSAVTPRLTAIDSNSTSTGHCHSMPYPYIKANEQAVESNMNELNANTAQPSFFKFLQKDTSGAYSLAGKTSMMNYPYINRVTPSGTANTMNRPNVPFIHAPSSHDHEDNHNNSSLGILSNVVAAVVSEDANNQSISASNNNNSNISGSGSANYLSNKRLRLE